MVWIGGRDLLLPPEAIRDWTVRGAAGTVAVMMDPIPRYARAAALCAVLLWLPPSGALYATPAPPLSDARVMEHSIALFATHGTARQAAVDALVATADRSLIPTFVLAMRWSGSAKSIAAGLSGLTGEKICHWHQAYDWQQANPQIEPHPTYRALKLRWLGNTDKRFLEFLPDKPMKIRLEEIVWGGVLVDGIAALDRPTMIGAGQADYLLDDDLVFGVAINGDARAYPLRIMGWHEMMNDVVGGVPVALAYCTLCGSGILFETAQANGKPPHQFGNSGLLYRSNKLMFDRATKSLWNQFTGRPVAGPLSKTDTALKTRPMVLTAWGNWRARHPDTTVLALETGYDRDYGSGAGAGVVYQRYFESPALMFPVRVGDESIAARKDFVFGIETVGAAKAWPLKAFEGGKVINDRVGDLNIVLIGDAESQTVRAYRRGERRFHALADGSRGLSDGAQTWTLSEQFLTAADGERLPRLPGRLSYWFAWDNYFGTESSVFRLAD